MYISVLCSTPRYGKYCATPDCHWGNSMPTTGTINRMASPVTLALLYLTSAGFYYYPYDNLFYNLIYIELIDSSDLPCQ